MWFHHSIGAGGVGGVELVLDTFTDANGVSISSHIPDVYVADFTYSEITTFGGTPSIKITSNRAQATATSIRTGVAVIDAGTQDCIVEADINKNNTNAGYGGCGLALRYSGSTGYTVELFNSALNLRNNGGTSIASAAFSFSVTETYKLKAVLNGSSIKIYIDDVLYIDTNDSTHSGTQHGISCTSVSSTVGSWADNLRIYL